MRIVVTGASGNVGSRTVAALLATGQVDQIVGVVRRPPASGWPAQMHWVQCDIGAPDAPATLRRAFAGADAVVHLAWQLQPSRDIPRLRRTNVDGSRAVFEAALAAQVPALVHASSVGAYSPGPKDGRVDETWPTDGVSSSTYSRQKSEVERLLDATERSHGLRVVRLRPALVFQASASSAIARYFLGPFVPLSALQRRLLPVLPVFDRLVIQAVHADDVGRAFATAALDTGAAGAFNLTAEPVLDTDVLARLLHARVVHLRPGVVRAAADLAWRARLMPAEAGWLDLAAASPVMSAERARRELGWEARTSSTDALLELMDGMRQGIGGPSAVLRPAGGVVRRVGEAVRVATRGGPGAPQ